MKSLILYFFLAYLISWVIWLPLYGPFLGITGLPVLPFHHGIGALGPMLAAVVTTYVYAGQKGIKQLAAQIFNIKPILYLLITLIGPFLLSVISGLISVFADKTAFNLTGLLTAKEFPDFSFLQFFLYNLLFFGFGEEVGWRGFALPILQNKFNALTASLILTVFWPLWHWPLFLYRPGMSGMGIANILGWLFSLLTGSVLLTWLYNSSKANLLVCAIFHSTTDIAFMANFSNQNISNYIGMLITFWGVVTIIVFKPSHLSSSNRVTSKLPL